MEKNPGDPYVIPIVVTLLVVSLFFGMLFPFAVLMAVGVWPIQAGRFETDWKTRPNSRRYHYCIRSDMGSGADWNFARRNLWLPFFSLPFPLRHS
jgi:hypothetical protein